MIRGITSNWKFVLSYFVSEKCIASDNLFLLVLLVNFRAMVCDQGANNRKCLKMFGINSERPLFLDNNQTIIGMFDAPHLFKSVRNTLRKSDIRCPDGLVSWNVLIELFNLEQNSITKCCPKITYKHIYPNNFEAMKVHLATQVLSRSVASAIKTAVQLNKMSNETVAISTYRFIEKFDKLFDCLNSRSKHNKNKFISAYTVGNDVDQFMEYMLTYISKISVVNGNTFYCFKGLIQTIRGVQEVSKQMFSEKIGIDYILTSRFNQDLVENLFAQVCAANGNNRNPSVHEFNHNIARITTIKILTSFSNLSNCEYNSDIQSLEATDRMSNTDQYTEINTSTPERNQNELDAIDTISDISEIFFNLDVPLQESSMRYFVGYVALKINGKTKCSRCIKIFIKDNEILESPSEFLITNKNYCSGSDFGKLKAPSDFFFNICKEQILIFSKMFTEHGKNKNLKQNILRICINNISITNKDFYSEYNPCSEHNKAALDFMILVLIRKRCSWLAEKLIKSNYRNARNPN